MTSTVTKKKWEVEKDRKLSLSQEERRKVSSSLKKWLSWLISYCCWQEYACGKSFLQLSDVKTWAEEGKSYEADLAENKLEGISASLLKDFELNSQLDISDKVLVWYVTMWRFVARNYPATCWLVSPCFFPCVMMWTDYNKKFVPQTYPLKKVPQWRNELSKRLIHIWLFNKE